MATPTKIHKLMDDKSLWTYYNALTAVAKNEAVPDEVEPTDKIFNVRNVFASCTGENFSPGDLARYLYRSLTFIANVEGSYTHYPDPKTTHSDYEAFLKEELEDQTPIDRYGKMMRAFDVLLHNDETQKPKIKNLMYIEMHPSRMNNFLYWAGCLEHHNHPEECDIAWRCIGTMCDIHRQNVGPVPEGTLTYLRLAAGDERFPRGAEHATACLRKLTTVPTAQLEKAAFKK